MCCSGLGLTPTPPITLSRDRPAIRYKNDPNFHLHAANMTGHFPHTPAVAAVGEVRYLATAGFLEGEYVMGVMR